MNYTVRRSLDIFVLGKWAAGSQPSDLRCAEIGSVFLVQGFGERVHDCMRKKTARDINKPIGELRVISDFLPPPEKLIPKEETIKITLAVDSKTLRFFKSSASRTGQKYQRIMREVLKSYARKYG